MAKAAFFEIAFRGECCVLALDIESFFDSIDHQVLKRNLCEVFSVKRLSEDWFAVFRSMTRYSWVDLDRLAQRLKFDPNVCPRPICSPQEYREVVRAPGKSLVETNREVFGIPQGSPLSAVLSNIYMMHFDLRCKMSFDKAGIYYRRYSDDIIIVCERHQRSYVMEVIQKEIVGLGSSMKVNAEKTEISEFTKGVHGDFVSDKPVTYLGFTYDGRRVLIRSRTLSRYYRRMTYAARSALRSAERASSQKVFLRSIYRDLTHLGKKGFYSYARRASGILDDIAPLRQLRRHFKVLQRKLKNKGR
jgi:hypothetical protein